MWMWITRQAHGFGATATRRKSFVIEDYRAFVVTLDDGGVHVGLANNNRTMWLAR